MTYPNPTHTQHKNNNADEASSLLTIVTAFPAPASTLRQDGDVPTTKKKNGGVLMRTMIVTTCFLLGTIAVIFYGGSSNTNSNINHASSTSEALLLRHNQAAPMYDPNQAYCFKDKDNDDKYCWYPTDNYPFGNWGGVTGAAYNNCGPQCTKVYPSGQTSGGSKISGPVL